MTAFKGLFSSNKARKTADDDSGPRKPGPLAGLSQAALVPFRPILPHFLPHKSIKVICTKEGIILHPLGASDADAGYQGRAALVFWSKTATVSPLDSYDSMLESDGPTCIVHGIAGILTLFQETYLLLISARKHIGDYAQSETKAIHCLTGILAIPLSDPAKAKDIVSKYTSKQKACGNLSSAGTENAGLDDNPTFTSFAGSDTEIETDVEDDAETTGPAKPNVGNEAPVISVTAKDERHDPVEVTETPKTKTDNRQKKQKINTPLSWGIGRLFWPSANPHPDNSAANLISLAGSATPPVSAVASTEGFPGPESEKSSLSSVNSDASMAELDRKILRETTAELTNGSTYYSHHIDITRCTQKRWEALKKEKAALSPSIETDVSIDLRKEEPAASDSLAQRADKRFWWNNWLSRPFISVGLDDYVTVLMQGYAQVEQVSVKPEDTRKGASAGTANNQLSIMVISRRSIERPGLRYQRRGVNEAGGTANFVETEFIVCVELNSAFHLSSFVQTRGSIPVFWSQSPWSLKPVPVLERSSVETLSAISKHFDKQAKMYFGRTVVVNLAEQTGKEGLIVQAYRDKVAEMSRDDVSYCQWDFHHITKGMRYEKISLLLEEMAKHIDANGSFWTAGKDSLAIQNGVFRTNCMDCLDRTNVVQSAFARNNLGTFLTHVGIGPLEPASQERLEVAFNEVWANNGDAISREYAGTSALKGDFVRSGKRNWRGQLNDATNSLARYWQNTVLDFFKQSMIDYVLGINLNAFAEFSEKMQTSDPGEITRLAAIRKAAVDACAAHVIVDSETKLHGWTVLAASEPGQIKGLSYEEKVLLVSNKAFYCCSFEYTLQKVRDFVRIPLGHITGLQKGEYILSALDATARDPEENFGFAVRYLSEGIDSRLRTYSIRNKSGKSMPNLPDSSETESAPIQLLAFKAIRRDLIRDLDAPGSSIRMTSRAQVNTMVKEIRQACENAGATSEDNPTFVLEEPLISLADAKNNVTILDRLNHELKNLVWL